MALSPGGSNLHFLVVREVGGVGVGGGHWEQRGIGVCVSCLLLFNCCYDIILGRGGEGGWGEVCVFIC